MLSKLRCWSKYNADSQIDTKPGPTDELFKTKPKSLNIDKIAL